MMTSEEKKGHAEACLKSNPNIDEFHQTSDGMCFTKEVQAISHSKTLADKTIDVVKRPGAAKKNDEAAEEKRAALEKKAAEEKAAADKKAADKKAADDKAAADKKVADDKKNKNSQKSRG